MASIASTTFIKHLNVFKAKSDRETHRNTLAFGVHQLDPIGN